MMARMNLVRRYWDLFDEICDLTKKYCKLLVHGSDEQMKLTRPIRKRRLELTQEFVELGDKLGLGTLSESETNLFLNNVFDKSTRKLYRKQAKRHKRTPVSMTELGQEVMAQKMKESSGKPKQKRADSAPKPEEEENTADEAAIMAAIAGPGR